MRPEDKANTYRKVFMSPEGRAVLQDIIEFTAVFSNSFDDSERLQERLSGQKDVGLYILDSLGLLTSYENLIMALLTIPAEPVKLQKEAINDR